MTDTSAPAMGPIQKAMRPAQLSMEMPKAPFRPAIAVLPPFAKGARKMGHPATDVCGKTLPICQCDIKCIILIICCILLMHSHQLYYARGCLSLVLASF